MEAGITEEDFQAVSGCRVFGEYVFNIFPDRPEHICLPSSGRDISLPLV
jgi:hypothetical protein